MADKKCFAVRRRGPNGEWWWHIDYRKDKEWEKSIDAATLYDEAQAQEVVNEQRGRGHENCEVFHFVFLGPGRVFIGETAPEDEQVAPPKPKPDGDWVVRKRNSSREWCYYRGDGDWVVTAGAAMKMDEGRAHKTAKDRYRDAKEDCEVHHLPGLEDLPSPDVRVVAVTNNKGDTHYYGSGGDLHPGEADALTMDLQTAVFVAEGLKGRRDGECVQVIRPPSIQRDCLVRDICGALEKAEEAVADVRVILRSLLELES